MARIPQQFIDNLLSRVDIVALIEHYIPVKKAGSQYRALCPFHNDSKPSLHITPQKALYHCFSCGAGGNAVSFVMDYEHLNFPDAIEQLASFLGVPVPREAFGQAQDDLKTCYDTLAQAATFYQNQLNQHANSDTVKTYLNARGLCANIITQFGIGFAPPGWDALLKHAGKTKETRTLLIKTGMSLQKESGGVYDRFRDRIMFPIRDQRGRVIAFGGRVMDDQTPKYLNSPETPVFHKSQALYGLYEARQNNRKLDQLLVVEGYMDVISLAQHDIHYAVATLGTAVTSQHLQRLLRTVKRVVFCFDGDAAGQKAAWRALEVALPQLTDETSVQFMFLPHKEDPDSMVKQHGKADFEQRITRAQTLCDFLFEHLSEQVNLEALEGRAKMISLAMPYLQQVHAKALRDLLLSTLANITRTQQGKLEQWSRPKQPQQQAPHSGTQPTPVRNAIAILLQRPDLSKEMDIKLPAAQIRGLALLSEIVNVLKRTPQLNTGALLEHFRERPEHKHLKKLATDTLVIPDDGMMPELEERLKQIHGLSLDLSIDLLIKKAASGNLTTIEKQKLQKLLISKKNIEKGTIPIGANTPVKKTSDDIQTF
jgi:DNA primase